jgi:hypothetical protein
LIYNFSNSPYLLEYGPSNFSGLLILLSNSSNSPYFLYDTWDLYISGSTSFLIFSFYFLHYQAALSLLPICLHPLLPIRLSATSGGARARAGTTLSSSSCAPPHPLPSAAPCCLLLPLTRSFFMHVGCISRHREGYAQGRARWHLRSSKVANRPSPEAANVELRSGRVRIELDRQHRKAPSLPPPRGGGIPQHQRRMGSSR